MQSVSVSVSEIGSCHSGVQRCSQAGRLPARRIQRALPRDERAEAVAKGGAGRGCGRWRRAPALLQPKTAKSRSPMEAISLLALRTALCLCFSEQWRRLQPPPISGLLRFPFCVCVSRFVRKLRVVKKNELQICQKNDDGDPFCEQTTTGQT